MGGLIPLNAAGQYTCPPAIVAMRAAVARMRPARELRPRSLPVLASAVPMAAIWIWNYVASFSHIIVQIIKILLLL